MGWALVRQDDPDAEGDADDMRAAAAPVRDGEADAELLARIADGDADAFGVLVARHHPNVFALCRRMLGDDGEAEDRTQEVFLKVWTKPEAWQSGGAKFSTWLYRVAANSCIDRLRKRVPVPVEEIPDTADDAAGPDTQLFQGQLAERVEAALSSLPERQRLALVATYYQDLSNREAAELLGVTVDALESLLARARRKLKELLSDEWQALIDDGGHE